MSRLEEELSSQRELQLDARQDQQNQRDTLRLSGTSEAWACWEYSGEEWALFDQIDWRFQRFFFPVLIGGTLVSLLEAILPWFFFGPSSSQTVAVFVSALLFGIVFYLLLLSNYASYSAARKRHKARQNRPQTVTFSRKGVWEAGAYFPLNEERRAILQKVTLTSQPSVLNFRLKDVSEHADVSFNSFTLHVLVPNGREAEAAQLLKRFQRTPRQKAPG